VPEVVRHIGVWQARNDPFSYLKIVHAQQGALNARHLAREKERERESE
jgi:hypothetical protein